MGLIPCRWNGNHVVVHALLQNTMNAHVKLSITTKYEQHGTSFDPGRMVVVWLVALRTNNVRLA